MTRIGAKGLVSSLFVIGLGAGCALEHHDHHHGGDSYRSSPSATGRPSARDGGSDGGAGAEEGGSVDGVSLRAALMWRVEPRELVSCVEQSISAAEQTECLKRYAQRRCGHPFETVAVGPRFPRHVRFPASAPPASAHLMGGLGSRLGLATLWVFVDGNANGRLDPVDNTATASADSIIGDPAVESVRERVDLVLAYRNGAVNPMLSVLYPTCEAPPEGYSILEITTPAAGDPVCQVLPVTVELPVRLGVDGDQALCDPMEVSFDELKRPPETAPLVPIGATTACESAGRRLRVLRTPGRFCVAANSEVYALFNPGRWDLTQSPPAWWPCTAAN